MTRTTIDFGIDLGTTNSAVAVLNGVEAEVVKNNENNDITPSAVYVDKAGRIHVGRGAKERVDSHPKSTASEFKLHMGTKGQETAFETTGRTMGPEELSAEVLKSLRADVRQRLGEEMVSAVITVPAAFELNQTDATKRAAVLAGLEGTPLIQEPTAAALAYGFQSEADNRFWLVYDLGGGTFDASVVHLRDGEITVVGHHGDNHLGGKHIDWAIVEQILMPAVVGQHSLAEFGRGVDKWLGAIAKLKLAAEEAKIALSRQDTAEVIIDHLCMDDRGQPVEVEHELTRGDVERLAEPLYNRTVKLCRQVLADAHLAPEAIDKVLLVGGPTLAPSLRGTLQDALGIELDLSQDPLTVVARGAAVFAGAQRMPDKGGPLHAGEYRLELDYSPIGADPEPFIGGRVLSGDSAEVSAGLAVELENAEARPVWRSGRVEVDGNGTFVTSLWAEKGRRNEFHVTLTDSTGRRLPVTPDSLVYTCGAVETQPLLTHTIGLGLADNTLMKLLGKGTPLPSRRVAHLRTTAEVLKGSGTGMIRIPVVEGERARADRNRRVGTLDVHPTEIARDVPAGSEVELTVEVDASRLVKASAYVPFLDAEFERVIDLASETVPDHDRLQSEVREARARKEELRARARANADLEAQSKLADIDNEGLAREAETLAEASVNDRDAATTGAKRVGDLNAALDSVEESLQWPELVQEAERLLEEVRAVVQTNGGPEDAQRFAERERETREAIAAKDPHYLEQRCVDLTHLMIEIIGRTGQLQTEVFYHLRERVPEMTDQVTARRLVEQGDRAAATADQGELANVNRQLSRLLPHEVGGGIDSTVTKGDR